MKWRKLGLVFVPSGQNPRMRTYAALPVAQRLDDELYRVYFSSRDEQNHAHIGFVEFNISSPADIVRTSDDCVLAPGPLGHFDDCGVLTSSIVEHKHSLFLYYTGWNRGGRKPLWYGTIGLAVSEDMGRTFRKISPAPIMDRSEWDPCLVASPCVLVADGIWRMWYVSGFKWKEIGRDLHSYYHLKYAESKDGIHWERNGVVCIDHQPQERNIARPCVIKDDDTYKMWYSYNAGRGYRIGYAESPDGYAWARKDDEAGIDVSLSGWDSRALAYPWVFCHKEKKYMIYNGNAFGRDGFGLAVEEL